MTSVTSDDPTYDNYIVPAVSLVNTDDDTADIAVTAISGMTSESGGTATFTIVLQSQPLADVTVHFGTSDANEGTTNGTSRTFTPADWSTPQTVTVTGLDDTDPDGDVVYSIVFSATTSSDAAYSGQVPTAVSVTNEENDYQQFKFVDSWGDGAATTSLYDWFNSQTLTTTDYIYIEVTSSGLAGGGRAWCAARADWYKDTYVSSIAGGGIANHNSGAWSKWARWDLSSPWSAESTASYATYAGYGEYRWYVDWEFSGIGLLLGRSDENEVYLGVANNADENLKVRTAASRASACGF